MNEREHYNYEPSKLPSSADLINEATSIINFINVQKDAFAADLELCPEHFKDDSVWHFEHQSEYQYTLFLSLVRLFKCNDYSKVLASHSEVITLQDELMACDEPKHLLVERFKEYGGKIT